MTEEIGIEQPDGSLLLNRQPVVQVLGKSWHVPRVHVPEIQWDAKTGITRYEWARRKFEILRRAPDLFYSVTLSAEMGPFGPQDNLRCSAIDYRTLPDWQLLMRLRSWVLPDDRTALIVMPPMDDESLFRYINVRPNNLMMISPWDEMDPRRDLLKDEDDDTPEP